MKPWIRVTRHDIENAILLGEIIGGYKEAFPEGEAELDLRCPRRVFQRNVEHCPTCSCKSEDYDECEHRDGFWECVATAVGASPEAEMLWMHVSNIVSDLHPDTREGDKYDEEPIKSWLASLVDAFRRCDRRELNKDLEAAALLRDGLLPPDVVVVSENQKKRTT